MIIIITINIIYIELFSSSLNNFTAIPQLVMSEIFRISNLLKNDPVENIFRKDFPNYITLLTGCNWPMQIRKSIRLDPLFNKTPRVKLPADLSTASSTTTCGHPFIIFGCRAEPICRLVCNSPRPSGWTDALGEGRSTFYSALKCR